MELYAEVIVQIPARDVDRVFHYKVPAYLQATVQLGVRVRVAFGSRRVLGYVVGFSTPPEGIEVKPIQEVVDSQPVLTPKMIALARWLADRYLATMSDSLDVMMPPQRISAKMTSTYRLAVAASELSVVIEELECRAPKQADIIRFLAKNGRADTAPSIQRATGAGYSSLSALRKKGLVTEQAVRQTRNPLAGRVFTPSVPRKLNTAQKSALEFIISAMDSKTPRPILLHGVTGSGKTEVYLQAIAETISRGRQAIVLVPEISLTPQTVERFASRFGGKIAVLHSSLSPGERYDEWWRVRRGEVSIVVGARSAVFAPFERLGLIVVDEEHENSYKQEDNPKYSAVEVAVKRGELEGAAVVLGSATPSLESYHRGITKTYKTVRLPDRIDDRKMPFVTIVDMRRELASGNRSMFSRCLQEAISKRLLTKEQSILFLNRRGYTTFISCRECGHVLQCPQCSVSLVYHIDTGELICHYCNSRHEVVKQCPNCRGNYLRHFGTGTQKVEEALTQVFPGARVLRMDVDTTTQKGAHERILEEFKKGKADILLGTQMIAKGLDFPSVTLVGVLAADITLNLPDFRAAERTFQLVTQVAGRAGRGERPGEVVVQTYIPDHYSLQAASKHDYEAFWKNELEYRRKLNYPPFSQLVRIVVSSDEEDAAIRGAQDFARTIASVGKGTKRYGNLELIGPAPCPVSKLRGKYRWHLILRGPEGSVLRELVREVLKDYRTGGVSLSIDVDPIAVL